MKPTTEQVDWAVGLVEKWKPVLELDHWIIKVQLKEHERHDDSIAEACVNQDYLETTIRIYPKFWEHTQSEQEQIIVHELAHCWTQQMFDMLCDMANGIFHSPKLARREWELLTQRIANIALKAKELENGEEKTEINDEKSNTSSGESCQ